jgi:putative DNA primase/helicase
MIAADIALRLGLRRCNRSWRGACPACNYPGAFSIKDANGRACAFCANGCTRDRLSNVLAHVAAGIWRLPDPRAIECGQAESRARAASGALRIWSGSTCVAGTAAEIYLRRRGLAGIAASAALRFRGDCKHPEGGRHPAIVALVVDVDGKATAVHRTYLTASGHKAVVEPAKASKGPVWGGAIRLDPEAPEIVIGEGIESSASAGCIFNLPTWAAVSAGNLGAGVVLPPSVRSVVIAADADSAGGKAAEAAAARWGAEGRRVRIACPDEAGRDFNDLLRDRMEMAYAA